MNNQLWHNLFSKLWWESIDWTCIHSSNFINATINGKNIVQLKPECISCVKKIWFTWGVHAECNICKIIIENKRRERKRYRKIGTECIEKARCFPQRDFYVPKEIFSIASSLLFVIIKIINVRCNDTKLIKTGVW